MKLVRKKKKLVTSSNKAKDYQQEGSARKLIQSETWKILIVDDEDDVHAATRLSIEDLDFYGKKIEIVNAMSAQEAREILSKNEDIAVALVDVVMETDDSGLQLVDFIRNEMKNHFLRIIIRTGQAGKAPERYVIENYDIDDYKEKTELTSQKLYTTIRSALKSYKDIMIIDTNRQGLKKILEGLPKVYDLQPMEKFFEGILTQIKALCNLGDHNVVVATIEQESQVKIKAGTGRFLSDGEEIKNFLDICWNSLNQSSDEKLPENSLIFPLKSQRNIVGFIYLENTSVLNEENSSLLNIMIHQCAAAFENLNLYTKLEKAKQQNEIKNQLLGMAAHDLRNPLGAIYGYVDLALEGIIDSTEALEKISKINGSTLALLNDILDIAKIESGKMNVKLEEDDIYNAIAESVEINNFLADSKKINILFKREAPIVIPYDKIKMNQVFNNLISNAIKFSHSNSTISIKVKKDSECVTISFTDQGQGIPADEIDKLFKPFSKTSVKTTGGESSTGLGLVICQRIIEAHQGKILVTSEKGKGATFSVTLKS